MTLAALCVSLIAILHSMMDFSLQDPGFSILVFGRPRDRTIVAAELAHAPVIENSQPRAA
jgi:hypothetical protein